MTTSLAWGILGTGSIAHQFAKGLAGSKTGKLAAVGSRAQQSADKFGDEFDAPPGHRHGSYDALLADDAVEAVYIATPHPHHPMWAIRAAEAGKHVLCEKPLGLNVDQAMAMIEAAREHGVLLMEAFMYRCHPQITKLMELIRGGEIGEVQKISAAFGFRTRFNPDSRTLALALGGGGILDVGCYPMSAARLIAGAEPTAVKGVGHLGQTGADEWAAAVLQFPGEVIAQIASGVRLNDHNVLRVYGTEGRIVVPDPWTPSRAGGDTTIELSRGGETQTLTVPNDTPLYGLEADAVAEALARGQRQVPAMTWDDTLGNMAALDRWRDELGLVYPQETPRGYTGPLHGRALAPGSDTHGQPPMSYRRIDGLDKAVCQLIMGGDNQMTFSRGAVMWDDWFERGGNTFDTAHIYSHGLQERLLGQWLDSRGVRDQAVVIGKGAHTPHCNPKALTRQLHKTLERLQVDHLDIYLMHRDNPEVPVGEFIDVLNEHHDAGLIGIFGGSNWSLQRFSAANEYARKHGKRPMSVLSDNFSLARMVDPVWEGCIAVSDPDSRQWLERSGTVHFAWSSQARGFFTDRSAPDKLGIDEMLERCWYSDDNFQRKARAQQLAQDRGVLAINIALAYVLNQKFPSFALVGPRVLHETTTTLPALGIELSDRELAYLDLRADSL